MRCTTNCWFQQRPVNTVVNISTCYVCCCLLKLDRFMESGRRRGGRLWFPLSLAVTGADSKISLPVCSLRRERQEKMKQEICSYSTRRYEDPSLLPSPCLYPLRSRSLHPFVRLSLVHPSSVHHQLFTRSRWIFQRVPDSLPPHLVPLSLFLISSSSSSSLAFPFLCASSSSTFSGSCGLMGEGA